MLKPALFGSSLTPVTQSILHETIFLMASSMASAHAFQAEGNSRNDRERAYWCRFCRKVLAPDLEALADEQSTSCVADHRFRAKPPERPQVVCEVVLRE